MKQWNLESGKVRHICSDNAANITKAIRLLNVTHVPCMAHTLQLAIKHGIEQSGLNATLSKCRKIVGHFKHSSLRTKELTTIQQEQQPNSTPTSLIQDTPTRWGSTLQMIERLTTHKASVLQSLETHKHNLTMLTENEWSKLTGLQRLLDPCEKASKLLGGEKYATSSVVLPVLAYLRKETTCNDDDSGYACRFKEGFHVDLQNRLSKVEKNALLQISTALDVRFKSLKCMEKQKREDVWHLIERLMADVSVNENDEPVTKKLKSSALPTNMFELDSESESDSELPPANSKLNLELTLYRGVPVEDDSSADPLLFWKVNANAYPTLAMLAKQYLAIPATSVPVERLFSTAGELISKKRNSLTPENAHMLLSLSC